ncbi:MAG: hypothetical protein JKY02_03665 [Flavobacteriaceae bacterium]|nr:hypothetical protein [Flavobacteriaceae bacterium]
MELDIIPEKIKKLIGGVSGLIFLVLIFGLGPTRLFGLSDLILEKTGYFFSVTIYFLDYGLISLIPFFGMMLNSKRKEFKVLKLLIDICIILLSTLISLIIGLYILTFIGKPSNPLIPQYLITEPIFIYSVLIIGFGIAIPFMFVKRAKKQFEEIQNIGIDY